MKTFNLILLLASHSVFALSGAVESKILGTKLLTLEYVNASAASASMDAQVVIDRDTRDRFCQNSLTFFEIAEAIYTLDNLKIREIQDINVDVSFLQLEEGDACRTVQMENATGMALNLSKGGHPQFILFEKMEKGVIHKLVLALSLPRKAAMGDLIQVSPDQYIVRNLKFGTQPMKINFAVIKVSNASWTYLEHGAAFLK